MLQPSPNLTLANVAPAPATATTAAVVPVRSEAVASTGLLLMFAAVIGVVLGVAVFGMGSGAVATAVIAASLLSFTVSMVCFVVDGRRAEAAEAVLPFPSMLRR